MTLDASGRSTVHDLLRPLRQIMDLVDARTALEAVEAVRRMQAELHHLDFLLSNLSVTSVVLVADRPMFVQLPPNTLPDEYAPEQLQVVRDALVEASVSLRIPQARSRAVQEAETNDGR